MGFILGKGVEETNYKKEKKLSLTKLTIF